MFHAVILNFVLLTSFAHLQLQDAKAADDAYRQGDYQTAIEQYETVLAKGYTSAELYYNLGNAYYRTEQMGRAILNYERALRLRPGMSDARENLALADSKVVDRIAELPVFFVVRWVNTLCSRVSPEVWRVVWLVLLAMLGVSLVMLRLGRERGLRKAGLITGFVVLLLLLLVSWLLLRSTLQFNAHSEAVVMQPAISVKNSPEEQSTDKMILHEGTRLTVSDSLAGWYKITIADGTAGWCRQAEIERI